jgi:predicted DNA-binding ribbon-helix-helix protein
VAEVFGTEDSALVKRSVTLAGHRTSLSLENVFWNLLVEAAREESRSINALVTEIDETRQGNLSSAVRVYLVNRLLGRRG